MVLSQDFCLIMTYGPARARPFPRVATRNVRKVPLGWLRVERRAAIKRHFIIKQSGQPMRREGTILAAKRGPDEFTCPTALLKIAYRLVEGKNARDSIKMPTETKPGIISTNLGELLTRLAAPWGHGCPDVGFSRLPPSYPKFPCV